MGSLIDYFMGRGKQKTACLAKERLQIILAHERISGHASPPAYFKSLQEDLVAVISKYINIDPNDIKVSLEKQGQVEVLEVNIVLSEQ